MEHHMEEPLRLPETGLLRIATVLKFIPVSEATWWEGVRTGRFPKRVKDRGLTFWRAEDIKACIDSLKPTD